ncbi:hypothetical protein SAMN05421676_10939 [Salinibacillus kushneri]|uniref:Uncharacterized protein n=1 Tax=Salinibacillus kushneri TaxID=237682 RepID=A0A1I0HJG3_9BACI|nr:hypothetical protein SAMN05421676_10939 [Salinibacillus kushneri]
MSTNNASSFHHMVLWNLDLIARGGGSDEILYD